MEASYFFSYVTIFVSVLASNSIGCNGHSTAGTRKALFVFGDSLFDPGNNQYLPNATIGPSDSLPYGETYFKKATGRISDGRIVPDFIAQFAKLPILGPYLAPGAHDFTKGSSFASGGAGVLEGTHQGPLNHFKDVKKELAQKLGSKKTQKILGRAVYFFSIGGNNYFSYYSANPNTTQSDRRKYVSTVISNLAAVLKEVYTIGGRKIAFQDVGSLGCTPQAIRSSPKDPRGRVCVEGVSSLARMHNRALSLVMEKMATRSPGLKHSIFDYYNSLGDRALNPKKYGFKQGTVPCYSEGKGGSNPGEYVFFDGGHTTERTNSQLAKMIWSGAPNVTGPYNVKQLFAF